jgi:Ni/Fe-hydrogenase subunit HybB-like protein
VDTQRTGQGLFHGASLISLILCAAGVLLWLLLGTSTGLGETTAFGLYVVGFFALMAAGAGLLLFSALPHTLGADALRPFSGKANVLALACLVGAGLFILADVGSPLNLWRMITGANFTSPFIWDFLFFAATFVLALFFLPVSFRERERGFSGLAWVLSLCAIALLIVEGSIVATVWDHPLLVVSFLITGAMAGAALMVWLVPREQIEPARPLRLALSSLAALWVFLSLMEPVIALFLKETQSAQTARSLLAGPYSPLFYFQFAILGIVPVLMLSRHWQVALSGVDAVAAGLLLLGVFTDKYLLLLPRELNPAIAFPTTPFNAGPAYGASVAEWSLTVGLLALVALLYSLSAPGAPAREARIPHRMEERKIA